MKVLTTQQRDAALLAAGRIEKPVSISIVNLAAGVTTAIRLTDEERDQLLAKCVACEFVKLTLEITAYEHSADAPNRRFVKLRDGAVLSAAKTALGRPFLRDHDQGNTLARGGTILESRGVRRGDGDYAIVQVVELTAPWAVELALRGLLTFVSIGLRATGPVLCSCCGTEVLTECWHFPGEEMGAEPGDEPDVCEWIYTSAEIVETSSVNVPAVIGAHIESIRAALSAALGGPPPEGHGMSLVRIAALLSLAATAGETEVLSAVESQGKRLKSLELELGVANKDLVTVTGERDVLKEAKLATEAKSFIDEAIGLGKIAPADSETWSSLYALDSVKALSLMAARKPGTSTPAGKPRQTVPGDPVVVVVAPTDATLAAKVDAAIIAMGNNPVLARQTAVAFGTPADKINQFLAAALGVKED